MRLIQDARVKQKFDAYPNHVREKMAELRSLVLETASTMEDIHILEETLKWGEPSYLTKSGSTIRMDWKPKTPGQYAMYFNCNTNLVETFTALFGKTFKYEKNRAILFTLDDVIPEEKLRACI